MHNNDSDEYGDDDDDGADDDHGGNDGVMVLVKLAPPLHL